MGLGGSIRQQRIKRGLTLSELARQSGVSKSYLSRIERDSGAMRPSADAMYRLAFALGVPVAELLEKLIESPTLELATIPDSLREFAIAEQLPDEVTRMLARVEYLGQRPRTVADFRFLLEAIKRTVGAQVASESEATHGVRRRKRVS